MATPSSRGGRPARMPRDARRAQVLRVAQELFTTEGFHHVSMDDIADRAQVSKPVLYRHFPSKLDLYLSVVDARGADLLAAVDAAIGAHVPGVARPDDAPAVVAAVVRAYLDFVDAAGEASALLFESDVRHDADVRTRVERATAEATRRLEQVLTGVAGVPADDAALLAPAVAAVAQEAATRRLRTPGGPSAQDTAALVARLAWGGVQAFLPARSDAPGGTLSAQGERGPADGPGAAPPA